MFLWVPTSTECAPGATAIMGVSDAGWGRLGARLLRSGVVFIGILLLSNSTSHLVPGFGGITRTMGSRAISVVSNFSSTRSNESGTSGLPDGRACEQCLGIASTACFSFCRYLPPVSCTLSLQRSLCLEEPDAGNLLVRVCGGGCLGNQRPYPENWRFVFQSKLPIPQNIGRAAARMSLGWLFKAGTG